MRAIPYALSVHHFISSVGADAGFAAIIGLALLVLLFFAHARETANLRRRADEAEAALHRLEDYVDQLAQSATVPAPQVSQPLPQVSAPPAVAAARMGAGAPNAGRVTTRPPVPVGAFASSGPGAGTAAAGLPDAAFPVAAGAPVAPAGVGAPALSAATRLIPAADDAISIRATRATAGQAPATVMDPPSPPPSTAAGAANGGVVRYPPPASAGQTIGARDRVPPQATGAPVRRGAPTATARRGRGAGRSRMSRVVIALVALLVVAAAAVVGLLVLTGSSTNSSSSTTTAQRASGSSGRHARRVRSAAAVAPASVTVAVLNGTSTTNLAHDVSSKLSSAGYKKGAIATAADQTHTATIVGYLPNDKRDALAVAKALKLGSASVQSVDQTNRSLACNGTASPCAAQVVVTVGSDLASAAG